MDYIHNNPVNEKIVTMPEDYYFSSARNYAALENELEVVLLDLFQLQIEMGTVCKTAPTIACK